MSEMQLSMYMYGISSVALHFKVVECCDQLQVL